MTDAEIINWVADRLTTVYGENPNTDFVLRLRKVKTAAEGLVLVDKRELALAAYKGKWAYDIRKKASEAFSTIENEELYDGL